MNARETSWMILLGTVVLALLLWYLADGFAEWTKTGDVLLVAIVYLLTNPDHLAILGFMVTTKGWRGLLAGLFVISAFDIASWSHYITQSGALPVEASSYAGLDTIIYRISPNFPLGTFGLYVVLPILLIVVAYEILYPRSFVSLFRRVAGA